MSADALDPLADYLSTFRDAFRERARRTFLSLVSQSGVDFKANRRQVAVVRATEQSLASVCGGRRLFGTLMAVGYACAVLGIVLAFVRPSWMSSRSALSVCMAVGVSCLVLAVVLTIPFIRLGGRKKSLEDDVARAKQAAAKILDPLNRRFAWNIPLRLIQETMPDLEFDPFLSQRRLDDLQGSDGLDGAYIDGDRSVHAVLAGRYRGNPFAFCEYLEMTWGEKTYTGTKTIHWQETTRGADGRPQSVTRTQTLVATVRKPIPEYAKHTTAFFHHDAAPNLSFSRHPSSLSGAKDGWLTSLRKKHRLGRLRAHARNLTDDSQFTLMANHEFETLFNAKDRDHEVEFRLLYTALAQQQTLALLKDKAVGYGDDFALYKRGRLNIVVARHLDAETVDASPAHFYDWDFDNAYRTFMTFNQSFFKNVYFALAPLLAVPLYQQMPGRAQPTDESSDALSVWECEALANACGAAAVRPPNCATPCLLKTCRRGASLEVTAHGFRAQPRYDTQTVLGGDGRMHAVQVRWDEYLPVQTTRPYAPPHGVPPKYALG